MGNIGFSVLDLAGSVFNPSVTRRQSLTAGDDEFFV